MMTTALTFDKALFPPGSSLPTDPASTRLFVGAIRLHPSVETRPSKIRLVYEQFLSFRVSSAPCNFLLSIFESSMAHGFKNDFLISKHVEMSCASLSLKKTVCRQFSWKGGLKRFCSQNMTMPLLTTRLFSSITVGDITQLVKRYIMTGNTKPAHTSFALESSMTLSAASSLFSSTFCTTKPATGFQ